MLSYVEQGWAMLSNAYDDSTKVSIITGCPNRFKYKSIGKEKDPPNLKVHTLRTPNKWKLKSYTVEFFGQILVVPLWGFEPGTSWLVVRRSATELLDLGKDFRAKNWVFEYHMRAINCRSRITTSSSESQFRKLTYGAFSHSIFITEYKF